MGTNGGITFNAMSRDAPPWLDPEIATYIAQRSTPPDSILTELIEETAT